MKKTLLFLAVVLMGMSMMAQTTYTRITSEYELEAGMQYLIVGYDENLGYCAMSYQKTSNRHAIQVSEDGGSITLTPASSASSTTEAFEMILGGGVGAWTFFDGLANGYLYASSSTANQLKTQATLDANGQWDIVFNNEGNAVVTAQGENTRNIMRFNENSNNGTSLFSCYNSNSSINVPVSLYKAGGAPVIYPEPSEYPSTFYSTVNGTSVTLDWTDSGGAQLPQRYLVVAAKIAIDVPVDGTPIADGPWSKNVNYGVEHVTFDNLDGNTTYHFAIFPYTNGGANIDYKNDGDYPTASAITADLQYFVDENFDEDLGSFTAVNLVGEQDWHQATYQGITCAAINGYSGTAHENEDWLISPQIWTGVEIVWESITIEFETAMKFPDNNPLRVMLTSDDVFSHSDPNECEWWDITGNFNYSTGNYEWVESGPFDITDYAVNARGCYLAFVYNSTDEAAASWEIDYVKVYGVAAASVGENETETVNIYPNPAESNVNIVAENDAEVQIIDMVGRTVMTVDVVEGVNTVSVADLESGVYFVKMNGAVVKFIKK